MIRLYRLSLFFFCTAQAGGIVFQQLFDCEYGEDIQDMVYFVRNVLNQKIRSLYDSRVGTYVGFGADGMRDADHFNSQEWKMKARKEEVETLCKHSARVFLRSTLERKVPPTIRVYLTSPADFGQRTMIQCSLWGFFPQEVKVSWLRDGVEVTADVSSTDVLPNGDWSFQLHSYLEFTPRWGERLSCRVEHSSLREGLELDWDTSTLDAKLLKRTVGISSIIMGFTAAAGGVAYYWWKQRFGFSPLRGREQTMTDLPEF